MDTANGIGYGQLSVIMVVIASWINVFFSERAE